MSYSILRIYNLAYTNVFEEFIQKIDLKDYDYEKVAKLFLD